MSYKILIADDEVKILQLMAHYLNGMQNVEVIATAADGMAAYQGICQHKPDIIITDICMPKMTGLELLHKLHEKGMEAKTVVISGYDEFDYVKEAMSLGVKEYLLKPFTPDELSELVEKLIKELDKEKQLAQNLYFLAEQSNIGWRLLSVHLIEDVLKGKYSELNQIDKQQQHCYPFNAALHCTCVGRVKFYRQDSTWDFSNQCSLDEFMLLIDAKMTEVAMKIHAVPISKDCFTLVFTDEGEIGEFQKRLTTGLNHLCNSLKKYYGVYLYFAIGNIYENWTRLPDSYAEAIHVFKTMEASDKNLYFYSNRKESSIKQGHVTEEIRDIKDRIFLEIKLGNSEVAIRYLEQLLRKYAMIPGKMSDFIAVSLFEMIYEINNFIEQQELSSSIGESEIILGYYNDLSSKIAYGNLLEIKPFFEKYIIKCCQMVSMGLSSSRSDKLIEQLKFIIETNKEEETLNLDMIADQVNLSPNYVRQIFKQKTGEGIIDYLKRCRMSKAVKLLVNTDMKVQDIANRCGYGNQQYFTTSFKKHYGYTPTNYKRLYQENEGGGNLCRE